MIVRRGSADRQKLAPHELLRVHELRFACGGDAMRIRYATFVDYIRWLRKPSWHKSESALLLSGLEPDSIFESNRWDPAKYPELGDASFRKEEDLFASIMASIHSDQRPKLDLNDRCPPTEWVDWATGVGVRFPVELVQALKAHGRENSDSLSQNDELYINNHTGVPGRPQKSMHLILDEFERRITAKSVVRPMNGECQALLQWLKDTHPKGDRPTVKTIENRIRKRYKEVMGTPEIK